MRKLLTFASALLLACGAWAGDNYLYWMLEENPSSLVEFAYGKIAAVTGEGTVDQYLYIGSDPTVPGSQFGTETDYWANDGWGTSLSEIYALLPTDPDKYSYMVELYNYDDVVVGVSNVAEFSKLKEFIYSDIGTGGLENPYGFTASVPEPSGGILCLLGFGLMTLRRRREKV